MNHINIGLSLKHDSFIYIENKADLYCIGGINFDYNSKLYNHGNVKITENIFNSYNYHENNRNIYDLYFDNIILYYDSPKNYGQFICQDDKNINAFFSIEYPKSLNINDDNKYSLVSLPFNNRYFSNYSIRGNGDYYIYRNFNYHPSKIVKSLTLSTLLQFNIYDKIAQWEPFFISSNVLDNNFDNTKAYIFNFYDIFSSIFISGIPNTGPYNLHNKGFKNLFPLKNNYSDYYDEKSNTYQPLNKILGGDYFSLTDSKNYGRNFCPFGNPSLSNIDLIQVDGLVDNILGVSIVNNDNLINKSNSFMLRFDSYFITGFYQGIPTGDMDALNLNFRNVMYIKFKNNSYNKNLVINNTSKTFSFNSSYKKVKNYKKLCLEFQGMNNFVDRAYVFAIDNAKDGEFIEGGEVRQPFRYELGSPMLYTLQNTNDLTLKDFLVPLHTNIISFKWQNKPIKLIVNNSSKFRNAKVKILDQENTHDSKYFIIVRKNDKCNISNNIIINGKYFELYKYGKNEFDIYFNLDL